MVNFKIDDLQDESGFNLCPSYLVLDKLLPLFAKKPVLSIVLALVLVLTVLYICHIIWVYVAKVYVMVICKFVDMFNGGFSGGGGGLGRVYRKPKVNENVIKLK